MTKNMSYRFSLIEHLSEIGCTYSLFHIPFITLIADFVPLEIQYC